MVEDLLPSDPVTVGHYRLLGRLGQGGMGQVYLARSPGGRPVAVKVIRPELAGEPGFRARFAREVAAARNVSGMFTALVVDADVSGPVPWLATAYVPGQSLAEAVDQQGPLPVESLFTLFAGLAEGLQAIHAAGVVHRDLKPSNVLLAADGPRVIDFGISRAREASMLTQTGMIMGSPGYMSPEQAEGQSVGAPSDVFSLGAVMTYAATGLGPFGTGPASALLFRVVSREPELARVPEQIRPLIERCLAKAPEDRPTPDDLLEELGSGVGVVAPDWLPEQFTIALARYIPVSPTPTPPTRATVAQQAATATPAEPAVAQRTVPEIEVPDHTAAELLTPTGVEVPSAVEELLTAATPEPAIAAEPAAAGAAAPEPVAVETVLAEPATTAVAETLADSVQAPAAPDFPPVPEFAVGLAPAAGLADAAAPDLTYLAPPGDAATMDARAAGLPEGGPGAPGGLGGLATVGLAAAGTAAAGTTPPAGGPPARDPAAGGPATGGPGSGGPVVPLDGRPRRRWRLLLAAAAAIIAVAGVAIGFGLSSGSKPISSPSPSLLSSSAQGTKKPTPSPSPTPSPTPAPTQTAIKRNDNSPSPSPSRRTSSPTVVPTTPSTVATTPSTVATTPSTVPTTPSTVATTPTASGSPGPQSISGYSDASPYYCSGAQNSPTGGSPVSFTVYNQSAENVQLYYYTASGALDSGGVVPPVSSRSVSTSTGYFWMVANAGGGCLNVFAIQGPGSVTVV